MIARQRAFVEWLDDIRGASERIITLTASIELPAFAADPVTRDAVLLHFLIVGEAARNLAIYFPGDPRHASLPLGTMRMMRNRLIHGYWDVDDTMLWEAARADIPDVLACIVALIDVEETR